MEATAPQGIADMIDGCKRANDALWYFNTHNRTTVSETNVTEAIEEFRVAARCALGMHPQKLQDAGVTRMIEYIAHTNIETLQEKMDGVSILFRTMHLKLQDVFCNREQPRNIEHVPSDPYALDSLEVRPMARRDLSSMIAIGRQTGNPLLEEDTMIRFLWSGRGNIIVGTNGCSDDIASYAVCEFARNGIHLADIQAAPGFEETYARRGLLRRFDWWIPHNVLRSMQTYLTAAPIHIDDAKETSLFTSEKFISFGGERNAKGEITHIHMGKLTDEFYSRRAL